MIALGIAVHAADALIVAANDTAESAVEIHLRATQHQIDRRREMRFVSPFLAPQGAGEKAFAEMLDLGIGDKETGSEFGHWSGPSRKGPIRDRAVMRVWLEPGLAGFVVARP